MNSKIIYIIIFFSLVSFQCKEKKELDENIIVQQNENQKIIETVLKNQLNQGYSHYIFEPGVELPKNEFTEEELEASNFIVENILKDNGYRFPNDEEFNEKVYLKLNRLVDIKSERKYLYVNFLDRCDRNFNYKPYNGIDSDGIYIIKNKKFISKFYFIPELLDYQKKYPEISKIENTINKSYIKEGEKYSIELWKELENRSDDYSLKNERFLNQQQLIHRNKYLFNDYKVSLVWLKANDAYFLESLVTTFGYTEDADLVAWVMKRNQDKAEQFLKENLFVKNCKGELEIRKGILKYIGTHTSEDEKTQQYAQALHRFDYEDKKWSKNERFKIIAYIGSTFDELFKKSETLGNTSKGRISFLGTVFVKSLHEDNEKTWQELEKNFKENNYYNLQNLKQLTSDAVEFESFPVRGSRWEE